jgi:hypothetical protein
MSNNSALSRRDILKCAVVATLSLLVRPQLPQGALPFRARQMLLSTRLSALFGHSESAKVVGSEYLRRYPQEADKDILLDQILSRFPPNDVGLYGTADHRLREQLDRMIRADFAADRIVTLRGWVLSATEAQLCALATLL